MHSISSSNFFSRPWCNSTPFYSRRARQSVHPSYSSMGEILERNFFFHRWDQKIGSNLPTLRNRFQHLLLLVFHHALKIFNKILFAALVHFYSVLPEENKIYCSSQRFILEHFSKGSIFFTDETKKVVLTCLRLGTGSNFYYFWSFTMHSISSLNIFSRLWCIFNQF